MDFQSKCCHDIVRIVATHQTILAAAQELKLVIFTVVVCLWCFAKKYHKVFGSYYQVLRPEVLRLDGMLPSVSLSQLQLYDTGSRN